MKLFVAIALLLQVTLPSFGHTHLIGNYKEAKLTQTDKWRFFLQGVTALGGEEELILRPDTTFIHKTCMISEGVWSAKGNQVYLFYKTVKYGIDSLNSSRPIIEPPVEPRVVQIDDRGRLYYTEKYTNGVKGANILEKVK